MGRKGTSERRVGVASAPLIAGAPASSVQAAGLTNPNAPVLRAHVLCGTTLLVLTPAGIAWRFADRRPDPVAGPGSRAEAGRLPDPPAPLPLHGGAALPRSSAAAASCGGGGLRPEASFHAPPFIKGRSTC